MNGILFPRPAAWGIAWSLYRRRSGTDSLGDPTAYYDAAPDYTAAAGSTGAVAWQVQSSGSDVTQSGEQISAGAEGVVYDDTLTLDPFDRVCFLGSIWEITGIEPWGHHRKVKVVRV